MCSSFCLYYLCRSISKTLKGVQPHGRISRWACVYFSNLGKICKCNLSSILESCQDEPLFIHIFLEQISMAKVQNQASPLRYFKISAPVFLFRRRTSQLLNLEFIQKYSINREEKSKKFLRYHFDVLFKGKINCDRKSVMSQTEVCGFALLVVYHYQLCIIIISFDISIDWNRFFVQQ